MLEIGAKHHTEMTPWPAGVVGAADHNAYVGAVGEWLAAGRAGQYVLLEDGILVGFWPTSDEAVAEGYRRRPDRAPYVRPVRPYEPQYRIGYARLCRD